MAANIANKLHPSFSPATLGDMMLGWLRSSLNAGAVDHGVFSAALFLKRINAEIRETPLSTYGVVTSRHDADAAEFFYIECVDAAAAMYLHNTKRYMNLFKTAKLEYTQHPIAWMLFLCDQLQEWLRPSGDQTLPEELLRRASKYQITVADEGIFYDYPPDANPEGIKTGIAEHLVMFGHNVVKRAT